MKYTESAINILTTKAFKGIGRAWILNNLKDGANDVNKIISLLNKSKKKDIPEILLTDFENKRNQVLYAINNMNGYMDGIIAIGDNEFPVCRGNVKPSEHPIFLFYKGNISLLNEKNKNIAVIGLLNPDDNIIEVERLVVKKLVERNATIVSGLALGCDTVGHKAALDYKGKTIAILPSPLKNILPFSNKTLADNIVKQDGLIVTEYLTDAKSKMELGGRYQERDRLQALFSDCIILSASYAKNDMGNDSGSRLAMGYALNYSISRAVIYDKEKNSNDPQFDLNRQCLAESNRTITINENNMEQAIDIIISRKHHSQKELF